ncbi:uncharacterized protein LOC119466409 isoform X2 [Dermacentor silvarum]|uniref:uncharacterized protein LOC119466409 isoform X2 n=1 Tax=Dermacentor silvarum TaxID=543639 RepID=UPI0021018849|nr:uncharacterized protein LOC119466409 isoform X2 [Dermacentor silvarum]
MADATSVRTVADIQRLGEANMEEGARASVAIGAGDGQTLEENTVAFKRSGTKEQYAELWQLMGQVSDMARKAGYDPRKKPRKESGTMTVLGKAPASAAAELRVAQQLRDDVANTSLLPSHGTQGENGQESGAHNPEENVSKPRSPNYQFLASLYEDNGSEDESTMEESNDAEALGERQQVQCRGHYARAAPRGLGAVQTLGIELLSKRKRYDSLLRNEELTLAKRRLIYEERRLELEERKLELEEQKFELEKEKHKYVMEGRKEERERLLERLEGLLERLERKTP